jgi:peroxiredoxin Q/BCP
VGKLTVGQPAPDFSLICETGQTISLRDFRGKQVVLYFYPKDDTPHCTIEACAFRDAMSLVEQAGGVVLGVSADSPTSHRRFSQKCQLPFRLLSDETGSVQRAYGADRPVLGRLPILGRLLGPRRKTFIIDRAGRLRAIFHTVRVKGHAEEILTALRA